MVALPALNKNGYWVHVAELFPTPIDKHFQEIALTLIAVPHLSRFPSIEALQFVAPEEWRKIFCQERLPSSRTLGEIIRLIGKNAGRVVAWKAALAARWIEETPSFGAASFTGGTSLEFIADHFQSYQCDNVTLDRLCEHMASSSRGKCEPGRWPVNALERDLRSNMRHSIWKNRQLHRTLYQPKRSNSNIAAESGGRIATCHLSRYYRLSEKGRGFFNRKTLLLRGQVDRREYSDFSKLDALDFIGSGNRSESTTRIFPNSEYCRAFLGQRRGARRLETWKAFQGWPPRR